MCGVYALVNAVDVVCGPLGTRRAKALFVEILNLLEARGSLSTYCTDGIGLNDVAALLKQVICKHYPIDRFKPFHRQPLIDKQRYFQTLDALLQQPNSVIYTSINGALNHWTLIQSITDKKLELYDSYNLHYLFLESCSMSHESSLKRHYLYPTHTYLLKRRVD